MSAASSNAAAFARLSVLLVLSSLFCVLRVHANELLVDKRTLQTNDLVTITVSLEGPFASIDQVEIPLRNLKLVGDPSVSSEFAWINGDVTRRKAFRYRARPGQPGPAQVGPIVLNAADGQRETLAALALQVMADRASGSNDAEVVLRELVATGRDPLFVIAEVDKTNVFEGEPVLVTWWLYNAASVQQWQVVSIPKLTDFWSEERPRSEQAERVYVGNTIMQRMPVRRVTLFPLRSGTLSVGGLTIEAAVMRRIRTGPFAMYEGELVETTFTSAPLEIAVKPIPPGPRVDAVGDLSLICTNPVQRNNGPVVLNVTLTGLGNVRAATAPHFETPIAGRVQVEGGEVTVSRGEASFGMARQWRFLIFPSASGPLTIPPLTMRLFDPAKGERRDVQCSMSFVNATMARAPEAPSPARADPLDAKPRNWRWLAPVALALLLLWLGIPRITRAMRIRREARQIARGATPAEIRARIDERLRIDIREQSDRGDAYRALLSLLTAAERDRDIAVDAEDEIERRVRDVLTAAR